jgi:hypothetical protein
MQHPHAVSTQAKQSIWLFVLIAAPLLATAQITYFGPTPYLQQSDTPAGFATGVMTVETMEDGVLDARIAASTGQIIGGGGLTDSVDIDDGVLDGNGTNGKSFFSGVPDISLQFASLPIAVGLVWTDGGAGARVSVESFGPTGQSLGVHGPFTVGDSSNTGSTAEDRFFGVSNLTGVSRIRISHDSGGLEIDHIQFSEATRIFANGFEDG